MKNTINAYSSHSPIFRKLFETFDIKTAFEYGIGEHSTPLFLEYCDKVVSVEMNTHTVDGMPWYDKVVQDMGERENWEHHNMPGKTEAIEYGIKRFQDEKFDLVFADGHGDTRGEQANTGFGIAKFVVAHDAQHQHTRNAWNIGDYHQIDFSNYCMSHRNDEGIWPITTVFCKSFEDFKVVVSWVKQEKEICSEYIEKEGEK